jgi:hypothetical protein
LKNYLFLKNACILAVLAALGLLIAGYHPGAEDDEVYLSAIKRDLNPALFPHDSDFFAVQLQATVFDKVVAESVRLTHLPLGWVILAWHYLAIYLVLLGCWRLSRRCFPEESAHWASTALVSVLLTLPIAGSALYIVDQNLHPRALATAAILAAVVAVLDRKLVIAGALLVIAVLLHPIMASFGISFCVFLAWRDPSWRPASVLSLCASLCPLWFERTFTYAGNSGTQLAAFTPLGWIFEPTSAAWRAASVLFLSAPLCPLWLERTFTYAGNNGTQLAAFTPLGWIFEPTSAAWRAAATTRDYYYLGRWQWYEWLGVVAPLAILWWFRKIGQKNGATTLAYVATRLTYFGIFQLIVAVALMLPESLERIGPLQPMRYLHLLYLIFIVLAGGLLGQKFLRTHWTRWALLFVPLAAGMFCAQQATYPASPHLEWPGSAPRDPWLEAFAWIRTHTPIDAYFAAGADYMRRPGEDYHGFRALAERGVLADAAKDSAVATQVPRLAQRWLNEVEAQRGWEHFGPADFAKLKERFGVDWVLVERPGGEGLECPYENRALRVCRVP